MSGAAAAKAPSEPATHVADIVSISYRGIALTWIHHGHLPRLLLRCTRVRCQTRTGLPKPLAFNSLLHFRHTKHGVSISNGAMAVLYLHGGGLVNLCLELGRYGIVLPRHRRLLLRLNQGPRWTAPHQSLRVRPVGNALVVAQGSPSSMMTLRGRSARIGFGRSFSDLIKFCPLPRFLQVQVPCKYNTRCELVLYSSLAPSP